MRAACTVAARNSLDSARNPRRAFFFGHGLGCTFAKALFCRRRRRASGAFEGLPALKPVFDSPYACAVRQLGPHGRKEHKRAGNLFRIGCDSEASRSHGLTRGGAILLSASSFFCSPSRALAAARPRAGRAAARAAPDLVRWGADERAHGHRRAGAGAEGRRRRSKISLRRGRGAAPRRCAARRRACEALLGTLGRYARVVCSGSVATETPRARTWKPEHCTVCVAAQLTHGAPPRWRRAPRW